MSSYDTYLEEQLKKEKKKAEEDNAAYEADNEALKKQTFATLEQSADAAAGVYRQGIEDAPLESRALYDQNAMREAVDRKKIQESLANMGMTDSGLSSSMQTALAVQKGRADNQVRADEQARIREMESAIDQIYANMELEKASQGLAIDQDTAAYKRNRLQAADTQATQTATAIYEANQKAATETTKMALDQQKNRADMAQKFLADGKMMLDAWAAAYKAYPDYSTVEGLQYAYYNQAREQGYPPAYANAMARAYVNTINAKGTEEQAAEAMSDALAAQARKVALEKVGGWIPPAESNDADGVRKMLSENMILMANTAMSDTERMEVVAYMVGTAYYYEIMKSTDTKIHQQIGEALEDNLSGIYLEIALACAGLK